MSKLAILIVVFSFIYSADGLADPAHEGRIAIIDISKSLVADKDGHPIAPVFEQLRNAGVLVIGRYFARCEQKSLWRKRTIDGDPSRADGEVQAILDNGFAIMSIYQYNSRTLKFTGAFDEPECIEQNYGTDSKPDRRFKSKYLFKSKSDDQIKQAKSPQAREGIRDAEAALWQASLVNQPKKTVIYFGVDYPFDPNDKNQVDGVVAYFSEIREQFRRADYRVGAYAPGAVLSLLLGKGGKEALIDIAWLLPSASYAENSQFHKNRHWHLFQSRADNRILLQADGTCLQLEYDTNIQNASAATEDLGFWNKQGVYKVPEARTREIFSQRRFVCDSRNLELPAPRTACSVSKTLESCQYSITTKRGKVLPKGGERCFAQVVRINPSQRLPGGSVQIDFRDYGQFDGSIAELRLTNSFAVKPVWDKKPGSSEVCKETNQRPK